VYWSVVVEERQKATRNLRKLRVRIAKADHGSTEYQNLQNDIHNAEVDVNYALYHPLDEKYQSLYPRNGDVIGMTEDGTDHQRARKAGTTKPAVWKMIESSMTNGTLEALRDGRLRRSLLDDRLQQHSEAKGRHFELGKTAEDQNVKGLSTKKSVLSKQDADSDGGFFEEWTSIRLSNQDFCQRLNPEMVAEGSRTTMHTLQGQNAPVIWPSWRNYLNIGSLTFFFFV